MVDVFAFAASRKKVSSQSIISSKYRSYHAKYKGATQRMVGERSLMFLSRDARVGRAEHMARR
jgi:hypothetical protein